MKLIAPVTLLAIALSPLTGTAIPGARLELAQQDPPPVRVGAPPPPQIHVDISELRPPPKPGEAMKEYAWLGVGTEEVDEALAAQLKLKDGAGLLVTMVSKDSPAEKAGLKKNDVLVEMDGQLLVHPSQLRKLIQSRKEGDAVNLTYYRAGKKDNVKAPLAKTKPMFFGPDGGPWTGDFRELNRELNQKLRLEMDHLKESLNDLGVNRQKLEVEIRRGVSEARKAMEEAMRNSSNAALHLSGPAAQVLKDLSRHGLVIGNDTTVIVKKDARNVRTMVRSDDEGSITLVAAPKLFLTVRDKEGKVLFDGEVETPEQRDQMPAEIKERVKGILEEFDAESSKTPPKDEEQSKESDGPKKAAFLFPGTSPAVIL